MSFGRKGLAPGAAAVAAPSGFGNRPADDDPMAARRAAFLAEERARAQDAPPEQRADEPFVPAQGRIAVPKKSMGAAYVFWFFLGGLSAHRFYLGRTTSGLLQALLTPIAYMMILGASLGLGLACLVAAWLWIIGDAFVIPGMVRDANERAARRNVQAVFA